MTNKKISRFEGRTYYKNQFGDLFQDDKKNPSHILVILAQKFRWVDFEIILTSKDFWPSLHTHFHVKFDLA